MSLFMKKNFADRTSWVTQRSFKLVDKAYFSSNFHENGLIESFNLKPINIDITIFNNNISLRSCEVNSGVTRGHSRSKIFFFKKYGFRTSNDLKIDLR